MIFQKEPCTAKTKQHKFMLDISMGIPYIHLS